jgi:rod shape-determining protein MreC
VVELSHDSRPIIGRGPPLGATFITLFTLSIALMYFDQRSPLIDRGRGWLATIAFPVQKAVDLPFRAWHWAGESLADRSRLRAENLELTGRLRLANLQLQRFAALEDENRRLRDMRENSAGIAQRVLVASILNVDLDPFRHRVLLDKGASDGVFQGQAVLDAEGIFGQVMRVNAHTSEAILISDAEHAIPVQSNRSGVRTIAVGTGDPSKLSLPFVTSEADLKVGDLLLSTGIGGVFPRGYPVAQITKVERAATATFALVEARPTANLDRDREVLLAWFEPPVPEEPAAPPAPSTSPPTKTPAATPARPSAQPNRTGPATTSPAGNAAPPGNAGAAANTTTNAPPTADVPANSAPPAAPPAATTPPPERRQ